MNAAGEENWVAYRARTADMRDEVDAYRAATAAKLARYQVAWLEALTADHEAAIAEDTYRAEALAAQRRTEYRAYLCMMADHGCICVALGFHDWARTQVTA